MTCGLALLLGSLAAPAKAATPTTLTVDIAYAWGTLRPTYPLAIPEQWKGNGLTTATGERWKIQMTISNRYTGGGASGYYGNFLLASATHPGDAVAGQARVPLCGYDNTLYMNVTAASGRFSGLTANWQTVNFHEPISACGIPPLLLPLRVGSIALNLA
ncbi:MAG TPA: hypothetical protein VFB78_13040 [Acidimicrobiales bacterium]|nr:hypothetical protein [Acidimicrobiales bacterium]